MLSGTKLGPIIVSSVVTVGFILVITLLVLKPLQLGSEVADILKILVGTLAAKFSDVVQFHIGSSAGSKSKDDILSDIVKK